MMKGRIFLVRHFIFAVVVTILGIGMAACSTLVPAPPAGEIPPGAEDGAPAPPGTEGKEVPEATEKVTIRMATWSNESNEEWLQAIVDTLNAQADSYQIVHEPSPDGYWANLQARMDAGDAAADLMWMTPSRVPAFAAAGQLLNITKCPDITDHPVASQEDYLESILDSFTYQGDIYGLPWRAEPLMLYVNQDHLDEAGIDSADINDWNTDDLQEISTILSEGGNRHGLIAYGGYPVSDVQAGQIPDWREQVRAGEASMVVDWASVDYESAEDASIHAFLMPMDLNKEREIGAAISGVSIYSGTANPAVACQALFDLIQAFQETDVFAPRHSMVSAERIKDLLPFKTDISAENIVESMFNISNNTIWQPYPVAPGREVIGDATLVPGHPAMLAATAALRDVLVEHGVKINVARTVRLGAEGEGTTYLAPHADPTLDRDAFVKLAEAGGVIIAVAVIEGESDLDIPPGPYAQRAINENGRWYLEYVDPDFEVVTQVDLEIVEKIPEGAILDEFPSSAIFWGTKKCRTGWWLLAWLLGASC